MPSLQIRQLPEDIYEALAARAQREGRSLAQQAMVELRRVPELAAADRRRQTLEAVFARGPAVAQPSLPDPVDLVREDRDA